MTVNNDGRPSWRTQSHMKYRTVFGTVDPLAAEHSVDPRSQPGLFRQLKEELDRLITDSVLRVIEVDARRFTRHTCAALRVGRK